MIWHQVTEKLEQALALVRDVQRKTERLHDAMYAGPVCDDATRARVEAVLARYQVDSSYATLVDAIVHAVRS